MARALRRTAGLAAATLLLGSLGAALALPAAAAPTRCAATAAAEPQTGHTMPPQANVLFPADFPVLTDCEWGYPLGGYGGHHTGDTLHHTPVIFVHGNQADAENWFLVTDQFKAAGYSDQELYALSYNGLQNGYAGLPTCCGPAPESTTYWQNTQANSVPFYEFCCNGGHGASDDPNVVDLYNFIQAVRTYTGSQDFDIVAHSLGVTITRKLMFLHPELRPHLLSAVMIAGGNHGTTVCRGIESSYYGCEEISPLEALPPGATVTGDPTPSNGWLYNLNTAAGGEAPGPTHWMSIYNGTDNLDPFFQAAGAFDDTQSPHLAGADYNMTCPKTYHNDLRVRPDIVTTYLEFILNTGQAAGLAAGNPPAIAISSQCALAAPAALVPEAPGPLLPLAALAALALVGVVRGAARRRALTPGSP